jgi:hypothetical protein
MSFGSFLCGATIGGSLVFGTLSYHVLRTNDGVQVVPKLSPDFHEAYVDVRQFTPMDWARHKTVVTAIVRAKKESIFQGAAIESLNQGVTGLVREFGPPTQ